MRALLILSAQLGLSVATFKPLPGKPTDDQLPVRVDNETEVPIWPPFKLPEPEEPQLFPDWARNHTLSETGCPCWFDVGMGVDKCACCTETGVQCGYPMHNLCQHQVTGKQMGCPGVPHPEYTLSTKGFPCNGDRHNRDCAWCVLGAFQCHDSTKMYDTSICVAPMDIWKNKCIALPQECGIASKSSCSPDAQCETLGLEIDYNSRMKYNASACVCNSGFVGNGVDCMEESSGNVTSSMVDVELTIKIETDLFEAPGQTEVRSNTTIMDYVTTMLEAGNTSACSCDQDIATCPA